MFFLRYRKSVTLMPNQAWIHWGIGGCAHHPPKRIHCNSFRHLRGSTTRTKSGLCSLASSLAPPPILRLDPCQDQITSIVATKTTAKKYNPHTL